METATAQMDIFFLVTTIVVAAVGVLSVVLLIYAIKFIRDARFIARAIRDEMTEVIDDIEELRKDVRHKAERFSGLLGVVTTARFLRRLFKGGND